MSMGFSPENLESDVKKVRTKEDPTYGGARQIGDSSALAKARYNRSDKGDLSFADWKKGREAQHLIPASLHKSFPSLTGIVDDLRNGMMLPSGTTFDSPIKSPVFSKIEKQAKPVHRKGKQRDHPVYSKNVTQFIKDVGALPGESSTRQSSLFNVMGALRIAHKQLGQEQKASGTKKFVDEISVTRMKTAWNTFKGSEDF